MLRFFLLGGRWGPVPAALFVVIGVAAFGAAGIVLAATLGTPLAPVGSAEALVFVLVGSVLAVLGLVRRRRGAGPDQPPPPPGL